MSATVQIVSILTPKPGNMQKVIDVLTPFNAHVEATEPDAYQYQLFKQINVDDGKEVLVYIELYKDMAALQKHRDSDARKQLDVQAAKQQLLLMPPDIKVLAPVGGFGLRV